VCVQHGEQSERINERGQHIVRPVTAREVSSTEEVQRPRSRGEPGARVEVEMKRRIIKKGRPKMGAQDSRVRGTQRSSKRRGNMYLTYTCRKKGIPSA
jgi:hypothetical protein